jgi:hypothetical protein
MFDRVEKIKKNMLELVEAKSKEMWTSEERKIIKKIGFKLNHLGE